MNLECTKANDHYLSPKRVLHADECASKVFYFRLAFKAIPGPDIKMVDQGAFEYFVEQVMPFIIIIESQKVVEQGGLKY